MTTDDNSKDAFSFGDKLSSSSKKGVEYARSDDKKAFKVRFENALASTVGNVEVAGLPKSKAPVRMTVYSAVIPVSGKTTKAKFIVNSFGITEPGTHTLLFLSLNDKHTVTHFEGEKDEQDCTVTLPFNGKGITDLRLTVALLAERDAAHPEASAQIAITDIGADAALTKKSTKRVRSKHLESRV